MAAVTGTYELADGTPDSGTVTLQPAVTASDMTPVPRIVTQGPVTSALDDLGAVSFEVLASDDDGWALEDGQPMPYMVTERLRSGYRAYAVVLMGPGPHDLAALQPVEGTDVAPYPVPGPPGPAGPPGLPGVGAVPETDAQSNTGYGTGSQTSITTGANNNAFGKDAQKSMLTGTGSQAVGVSAQAAQTTGVRNTAVGHQAQMSNVTANDNTGVGYFAQRMATAVGNTAVGSSAQSVMTTGTDNTAVGRNSQLALTTGASDTGVGRDALAGATTGSGNTAVGYQAMHAPKGLTANTTAATDYGTAVGYQSGAAAAGSGAYGTALGYRAITANDATALGANAEARAARSTAVGYGAVAALANQIMIGSTAERVDIPGTLYVKGVQVGTLLDALAARVEALEARLADRDGGGV